MGRGETVELQITGTVKAQTHSQLAFKGKPVKDDGVTLHVKKKHKNTNKLQCMGWWHTQKAKGLRLVELSNIVTCC